MRDQKSYQTPFHYWVSFFPTAPLFGVRWRFESLLPGAAFFRPGSVAADMTRASMREATVATEQAFAKTAQAAEEAIERTVETVETVAHSIEASVDVLGEDDAEPALEDEAAPEGEADDAPAAPPRPASLLDAAPEQPDDLKQIKGVGPKLEEQLNALGIYTYAQIAGFSQADLDWLDLYLGTFRGRPERDDWIGQAKTLV